MYNFNGRTYVRVGSFGGRLCFDGLEVTCRLAGLASEPSSEGACEVVMHPPHMPGITIQRTITKNLFIVMLFIGCCLLFVSLRLRD